MTERTLIVDYDGTITFIADAISGQTLTLLGDLLVSSGSMAMTGNFNVDDSSDAIPSNSVLDGLGWTIVADNITISSNAIVHADGLGFASQNI